jgi:hypothetical protein
MKTFTITEVVTKGIQIDWSKGKENGVLGLLLGEGPDKDIEETVRNALMEETSHQVLRGDNDTSMIEKYSKALEGEDTFPAILHWADLGKENDRLLREKRPQDRDALVLVRTMPGHRGKIAYYANTFDEVEDESGVTKVPRAFPPPGVHVLARKEVEHGVELLLKMRPRAAFRISRTGQLEGAPPELVVTWNGWWDPKMRNDSSMIPNPANWGMKIFARTNRHGRIE